MVNKWVEDSCWGSHSWETKRKPNNRLYKIHHKLVDLEPNHPTDQETRGQEAIASSRKESPTLPTSTPSFLESCFPVGNRGLPWCDYSTELSSRGVMIIPRQMQNSFSAEQLANRKRRVKCCVSPKTECGYPMWVGSKRVIHAKLHSLF